MLRPGSTAAIRTRHLECNVVATGSKGEVLGQGPLCHREASWAGISRQVRAAAPPDKLSFNLQPSAPPAAAAAISGGASGHGGASVPTGQRQALEIGCLLADAPLAAAEASSSNLFCATFVGETQEMNILVSINYDKAKHVHVQSVLGPPSPRQDSRWCGSYYPMPEAVGRIYGKR